MLIYESTAFRIVGAQIGAWSQLQVAAHHALPPGGPAYLNAWCDFNTDGDVADAGERIATNVLAVEGVNLIAFFTPPAVTPGVSVMRVRLASGQLGAAGYGGFGGIGEVEDHRIDFVRPSGATNVQAHEANGQVWITWQFNTAAPAQVYEVY